MIKFNKKVILFLCIPIISFIFYCDKELEENYFLSQYDDWKFYMDIKDNILFITLYNTGILFIDITDPFHPIVLEELKVGNPFDVQINENYLFVSDMLFNGISIVDISELYNPSIIGNIPQADNAEIKVLENYIFYLNDINEISLRVADVTNPENIIYVDKLLCESLKHFDIQGDFLFLLDNNKLKIINISNKSDIFVESELTLDLFDNLAKIKCFNNVCYIINNNKLNIIDVHSITNPSLIDTILFEENNYDFDIKEDLLYIASGSGIIIYNIENLGNHFEEHRYLLSYANESADLLINNNLLFLTLFKKGLLIFDISEPLNIKRIL